MTLYIIDIDGTIADDRLRKLKAGPEPSRDDVPEYMSWLRHIQSEQSLSADPPIPGMASLLRGIATQQALFVYLTAREEKYRETTQKWLKRHGFPTSLLIMRPNGSWLSSADLKRQHILELTSSYPTYQAIAIDDDGSGDCAAMYAQLDIPHLHMKLPELRWQGISITEVIFDESF